ncbi:hypothetical protein QAD02_023057 [Eretmocerus hayati]|uniref:Uncharacterized protein n=1 Tax=Eretmocerus hayati TaxID=131215 RepID=A0ACC2PUV0_9HYME|nr:hypothetical protein QAD02_023057 [Eretmocerus hayati]
MPDTENGEHRDSVEKTFDPLEYPRYYKIKRRAMSVPEEDIDLGKYPSLVATDKFIETAQRLCRNPHDMDALAIMARCSFRNEKQARDIHHVMLEDYLVPGEGVLAVNNKDEFDLMQHILEEHTDLITSEVEAEEASAHAMPVYGADPVDLSTFTLTPGSACIPYVADSGSAQTDQLANFSLPSPASNMKIVQPRNPSLIDRMKAFTLPPDRSTLAAAIAPPKPPSQEFQSDLFSLPPITGAGASKPNPSKQAPKPTRYTAPVTEHSLSLNIQAVHNANIMEQLQNLSASLFQMDENSAASIALLSARISEVENILRSQHEYLAEVRTICQGLQDSVGRIMQQLSIIMTNVTVKHPQVDPAQVPPRGQQQLSTNEPKTMPQAWLDHMYDTAICWSSTSTSLRAPITALPVTEPEELSQMPDTENGEHIDSVEKTFDPLEYPRYYKIKRRAMSVPEEDIDLGKYPSLVATDKFKETAQRLCRNPHDMDALAIMARCSFRNEKQARDIHHVMLEDYLVPGEGVLAVNNKDEFDLMQHILEEHTDLITSEDEAEEASAHAMPVYGADPVDLSTFTLTPGSASIPYVADSGSAQTDQLASFSLPSPASNMKIVQPRNPSLIDRMKAFTLPPDRSTLAAAIAPPKPPSQEFQSDLFSLPPITGAGASKPNPSKQAPKPTRYTAPVTEHSLSLNIQAVHNANIMEQLQNLSASLFQMDENSAASIALLSTRISEVENILRSQHEYLAEVRTICQGLQDSVGRIMQQLSIIMTNVTVKHPQVDPAQVPPRGQQQLSTNEPKTMPQACTSLRAPITALPVTEPEELSQMPDTENGEHIDSVEKTFDPLEYPRYYKIKRRAMSVPEEDIDLGKYPSLVATDKFKETAQRLCRNPHDMDALAIMARCSFRNEKQARDIHHVMLEDYLVPGEGVLAVNNKDEFDLMQHILEEHTDLITSEDEAEEASAHAMPVYGADPVDLSTFTLTPGSASIPYVADSGSAQTDQLASFSLPSPASNMKIVQPRNPSFIDRMKAFTLPPDRSTLAAAIAPPKPPSQEFQSDLFSLPPITGAGASKPNPSKQAPRPTRYTAPVTEHSLSLNIQAVHNANIMEQLQNLSASLFQMDENSAASIALLSTRISEVENILRSQHEYLAEVRTICQGLQDSVGRIMQQLSIIMTNVTVKHPQVDPAQVPPRGQQQLSTNEPKTMPQAWLDHMYDTALFRKDSLEEFSMIPAREAQSPEYMELTGT